MKIFPQQSRIVVEAIPNDDTPIKAVFLKNTEDDNTDRPAEMFRYRVIEVGPGRILENGTLVEMPVKVGNEVTFNFRFATALYPETWYGGKENSNPPHFGSQTKFVVDYAGVLAVIERDPADRVSRFSLPEAKPEAQIKPQILVPSLMSIGQKRQIN